MMRSLTTRCFVILAVICVFSGGFAAVSKADEVAKTPGPVTQMPAGQARITGLFSGAPDMAASVPFEEYWRLWAMIRAYHFDGASVPNDKLFYGSLAGMVRGLDDPYSSFFDPVEAKKFMEHMSGKFFGIGAVLDAKKGYPLVVRVIPGSPAERAGLKAGDQIVKIDDTEAEGKSLDECVAKIRGPKGTEVRLLIVRTGLARPKELTITRDEVSLESVRWKIIERGGKRLALIELMGFQDDTGKQFDEAVAAILKAGAKGLILDLRDNPGGLLEVAIDIAGEWIGDGAVVQEKFTDGRIKVLNVKHDARLAAMPTVVLANGYSASASEVLTGALQDYGKIRIVGEKTYGKGCVQAVFHLPDESIVKLTVSLWLMPQGRLIHKVGIEPDVAVPLTEDDAKHKRDPQLNKAIELLTK